MAIRLKCGSDDRFQYGFVKRCRQNHQPKSCRSRRTLPLRRKSAGTDRQTTEISVREIGLYSSIEGLASRIDIAVYDSMQVSDGSVQGLQLDSVPEVVETDALHISMALKTRGRIWIAVDRYGIGFGHRLFCYLKNASWRQLGYLPGQKHWMRSETDERDPYE